MIDLKQTNQHDPVKRNVEKGLDEVENSPMDPPEAYSETTISKIPFDKMEEPLQVFMKEHKVAIQQIDSFEKALVQFKNNGYKLDQKINEIFGEFFKFFDNNILIHNNKEEKVLFPLLNKKLLESGEHSKGDHPITAIDLMEDDHIKFIQLGALTFNLLGLATRIQDAPSRIFIFDTAYENGRELIELLKLHIYREDYTLFPLAHKLISKEEYAEILKEMGKFH